MSWRVRTRTLPLDRPFVLGIVNVTPDSFSDGGLYFGTHAAARPCGAAAGRGRGRRRRRRRVDAPAQRRARARRRMSSDAWCPSSRTIRRRRPDALISRRHGEGRGRRAALAAGADVVNDVSGLRLDPTHRRGVCARPARGVVLMHSRGNGRRDGDATRMRRTTTSVADVARELARARWRARRRPASQSRRSCSIPASASRSAVRHSLALLRALPTIVAIGRPVLVGASRKRFVGEAGGVHDPRSASTASVGAHVAALGRGAGLFRVHDVRAHRQALDVAWAVLHGVASPAWRSPGTGRRRRVGWRDLFEVALVSVALYSVIRQLPRRARARSSRRPSRPSRWPSPPRSPWSCRWSRGWSEQLLRYGAVAGRRDLPARAALGARADRPAARGARASGRSRMARSSTR